MRVILKPGAVAVLLITVVSLTVLALWRYNGGDDRPTPAVAAPATAPAPVTGTTAAGGNTKALQAEVTRPMKNHWDAQDGMLTAEPVAAGEYLTASVWARSPTKSQTTVGFGQSAPPYENIATKEFALTPEWTEYHFDFASTRAFKAGEAAVKMRLAHKPGVIEVAGIRLTRKTAP